MLHSQLNPDKITDQLLFNATPSSILISHQKPIKEKVIRTKSAIREKNHINQSR